MKKHIAFLPKLPGIKAQALLLRPDGEGRMQLSASDSVALQTNIHADPLELLQDDCEIPILVVDVSPGKQLHVLRSLGHFLSQGRIFGIFTHLSPG